ncbi:aspartyl protease family protein [Oleiharenicola lentus]|uniref:aspartyl protease family protein n=1 Tax=Oleiharenicola lentus TaxID=2508720 RepID=UPI003F67127F
MSAYTGSMIPAPIGRGIVFPGKRVTSQSGNSRSKLGVGLLAVVALVATGCLAGYFLNSRSEQKTIATKPYEIGVPANVVANLFLVESTGAYGEPRRFLIDTGSTITLVSPEFAARYATANAGGADAQIQAPTGAEVVKSRVTVSNLKLGKANFAQVPAVISDLGELSHYLGLRVDGIVGFPVFKNYLLTLDYSEKRMTIALRPVNTDSSNRGLVFSTRGDTRVPFVNLSVGGQACEVLIDTGSDGGVSLNPEGLKLNLVGPARAGALVSTVAGDRRQYLARIEDHVEIGGTSLQRPVVDFTFGKSSVGGEVLRNFALTFDQKQGEVTFRRVTEGAVELAARRTVGMSFSRASGSWEISGIVPQTPTSRLALQAGDRCVSINGESVDRWPAERYAALMRTSDKITFTFAHGDIQTDYQIPVVSLLE